MSKVILPVNPYISEFDYAIAYNLVTGKAIFSLQPSIIQNASGITGVTVELTTPTGSTLSSQGFAFTPTNIAGTYEMNIPRFAGVIMWGIYKSKATLKIGSDTYIAEKAPFNLCAVSPDNIYTNEGRGKLDIQVNCKTGKVLVSGLTGNVYNSKAPALEVKNVTYYHPPEAELPPQKNLSNLPFELVARIGMNIAKGSSINTYNFDEHISVVIKFIADTEKVVKCNANLDALYTGMKRYYENYSACRGSKQQDCCQLAELAALLSIIQLGLADGRDVSWAIDIVEKILDVDCRCGSCDGDPVVPLPNTCFPVNGLNASITQFNLNISFSTVGLAVNSEILIEYRLKSSAPGGAWSALTPNPITNGQTQSYNVTVATIAQYQVRVTVLCPGGQSTPVEVETNVPPISNCVEVSGISGSVGTGTAPTTAPQTTIPVPQTTNNNVNPGGLLAVTDFDPLTLLSNNDPDNLSYLKSSVFNGNQLVFQLGQATAVPQGKYVVIKVAQDVNLTTWFNTNFNQGSFPDQAFREGLISKGAKYYIARNPFFYDVNSPLTLTRS